MTFEDPSTRHYTAIGRYVARCSVLEVILLEVLHRISGIPNEDLVRAVIGGVGDLRVTDSIQIVKRSADAAQLQSPELTLLLVWCSYFNDIRQVIAHKPFFINREGMWFHNYRSAKARKSAWQYKCTVRELKNACTVMETVSSALELAPRHIGLRSHMKYVPGEPHAALLEKLELPARPADKRQPIPQ